RISSEISCSLATSTPKPRSAARASPDSLSSTLLYIQAKYRTSRTGLYPSVWGQLALFIRRKLRHLRLIEGGGLAGCGKRMICTNGKRKNVPQGLDLLN